MLELKNITKNYKTGDTEVLALKGISVSFRKSEFVSVLGHSGCGKTTLLNIIGGLDRYTDGDLLINGRSTELFRDRDWDEYRNHSIGFVFQSYNLIPHQTVLANVELSLTLAGIGKAERRERAIKALTRVGLGDQLKKKPSQMSGGQMQRVAIARALVNDPDIVLADEPTGALDSETSVQVMELLKEIAQDRLVIMVTHNPELAQQYSTRIIKLLDGKLVSDSNPYEAAEAPIGEKDTAKAPKREKKEKKFRGMSFFTAFGLSLNNLMTKRTRTFLTSFAGSIGIIGIALILALSTGINAYIDTVQEDTLSSYPITLQRITQDYSAMTAAMGIAKESAEREVEEGIIYVDDSAGSMMTAMAATKINDLAAFRTYLEQHRDELEGKISNIQYDYGYSLQIFSQDGKTQVCPTTIFEHMGDYFSYLSSMMASSSTSVDLTDMFNIFSRMQDNEELLRSQYDLIEGEWADGTYEMMLVLDENNSISNLATYVLGINDQNELEARFNDIMQGKEYRISDQTFTYDDFLGMTFYVVPQSVYYRKTDKTYTADGKTYPIWEDVRESEGYDQAAFAEAHGIPVTVTGILRPNEDAIAPSIQGVFAYNASLTEALIAEDAKGEAAVQQKETPDVDIFSGVTFASDEITREAVVAYLDSLSEEEYQSMVASMSVMMSAQGVTAEITPETLPDMLLQFASTEQGKAAFEAKRTTQATYDDNLTSLGYVDVDSPSAIYIYALDFEGKDAVTDLISAYNNSVSEEKQIQYNDLVGLLMSSITTIINVISYVLIAFVSISLLVSSIMIGIITYISVLERTKEIGVLRAMGASKRDIARVFNAETLIVGLCSGIIGIGATLLLCLPVNALIRYLSGIGNIGAQLPVVGAVTLILISVLMTVVAGFIPSRIASKRDPVEALRSE